jgi:hypothetical protein
MTSSRNLGTL